MVASVSSGRSPATAGSRAVILAAFSAAAPEATAASSPATAGPAAPAELAPVTNSWAVRAGPAGRAATPASSSALAGGDGGIFTGNGGTGGTGGTGTGNQLVGGEGGAASSSGSAVKGVEAVRGAVRVCRPALGRTRHASSGSRSRRARLSGYTRHLLVRLLKVSKQYAGPSAFAGRHLAAHGTPVQAVAAASVVLVGSAAPDPPRVQTVPAAPPRPAAATAAPAATARTPPSR